MPRLPELFATLAVVGTLGGCAPRPRMCDAQAACPARMACVAGRCQREGAEPAISTARRIVLEPAAVAYVRRGEGESGGAMPSLFTLGRRADGDSALLLRFAAPLAPDAAVIEAYILLERSQAVDMDPTPIGLYAARITAPWDARSVSWATQPPIEDTRSPVTLMPAAAHSLVRIDVRALVEAWRKHDPRDQGIAILAQSSTVTGATFASGRLELYVK
jgi:hypothetical protein